MALKKKLSLVLCILAIWAVDHANCASPRAAPSPSVDCSSLILNLVDCLTFVSNGSTISKPEGTCCSGLKTVLKTDADCLCEGFKGSAQFGVVLNVSKALSLPAACRISAPSIGSCGLSTLPGAAPALPPSASTAPTTISGAHEHGPAPAPESAGSASLSISFATLVAGLVVAFM